MTDQPIPSYAKPPVIEVVWSVQFAPLPWLTAAHTGVFWNKIREDFPACEEHPPIERKQEPESLLEPRQIIAEFSPKPPLCRQWFISSAGNDLVQVQGDRFCVNWRKVEAGDQYPRYAYVRDQFTRRWQQFCDFVRTESGSVPQVELLEMTYVNHIFKGEGWSSPRDIGNVFPAISFHEKPKKYLPPPATLGSNIVFDIAGPAGRLHVTCRHARFLGPEEKELFRLDLIARGKTESGAIDDMLAWFSKARQWIVCGFADLTSDEMQAKQWGIVH